MSKPSGVSEAAWEAGLSFYDRDKFLSNFPTSKMAVASRLHIVSVEAFARAFDAATEELRDATWEAIGSMSVRFDDQHIKDVVARYTSEEK